MRWIVYRIAPGAVTHRVEVEAEGDYEAWTIAHRECGWDDLSVAAIAIHNAEHMEEKRRRRACQPCTGCGQCCMERQCTLGFITFGERLPCPGLLGVGSYRWCSVLTNLDEPQLTYTAKFLAIGEGCGWRH